MLLLGTLRNALTLNDVCAEVLTIVTGSLLLLSVLGPSVTARVREALRRGRGVDTTPNPHYHLNPVRRAMSISNKAVSRRSRSPSVLAVTRLRLHQGRRRRRGDAGGDRGGDRGGGRARRQIKQGLKIAFLPKQINNPYFTISDKGGEDAAKAFGGEFKRVGPSDATRRRRCRTSTR